MILHETGGLKGLQTTIDYLRTRSWGVHGIAMPDKSYITAPPHYRLAHSAAMPDALGVEMPWHYYPGSLHEPQVNAPWAHRKDKTAPKRYAVPTLSQLEHVFDLVVALADRAGYKKVRFAGVDPTQGSYTYKGPLTPLAGVLTVGAHARIRSDGHADGFFAEAYCVARSQASTPGEAYAWSVVITEAASRPDYAKAFALPKTAAA